MGLLDRHTRSVRNGASGLARNHCGHLAGKTGTSGTKSSHLGIEYPGAAGSGEVKTCRGGDVVRADTEQFGSDGPVYIPIGVGRVTPKSLAGVVDG